MTTDNGQHQPERYQDVLEHQSGLQDARMTLNKTRITRWSHRLAMEPQVGDMLLLIFNGTKATYSLQTLSKVTR